MVEKITMTTKIIISSNTFERDRTSPIDHGTTCNEISKLDVKEKSLCLRLFAETANTKREESL